MNKFKFYIRHYLLKWQIDAKNYCNNDININFFELSAILSLKLLDYDNRNCIQYQCFGEIIIFKQFQTIKEICQNKNNRVYLVNLQRIFEQFQTIIPAKKPQNLIISNKINKKKTILNSLKQKQQLNPAKTAKTHKYQLAKRCTFIFPKNPSILMIWAYSQYIILPTNKKLKLISHHYHYLVFSKKFRYFLYAKIHFISTYNIYINNSGLITNTIIFNLFAKAFETMRQISAKQAEKWLDKLKNQNPNAFKEVGRILKKYEKAEDQYDCFIKISHILLQVPFLARDINSFLEEGNKFVINQTEMEKITKLVGYVRQSRMDKFRQILEMIQKMSTNNRNGEITPQEQNRNLIACLKDIVKGDAQLQQITEKALLSGEQLINNLDLQHLKVNHQQIIPQPQQIQDNQGSELPPKKKVKKDPVPKPKQIVAPAPQQKHSQREPVKTIKLLPTYSPLTPNQQKRIFKHLQKSLGLEVHDHIVKLIHIYNLCIISKAQCIALIDFVDNQEEFQYLRDIIQSRQSDRRRLGAFRPLNDNDYSITQRASPSYVTVPSSYPIRCSNRTPQLKQILNEKWVSVPYGSQENFNIRNKNIFEASLLKSEDERYEFDLYTNRLKKSIDLLDKVLEAVNPEDSNPIIQKIIQMGVIQVVYKNANKQQKQEIQWHLKSNQQETCKLFKQRINFQLNQLKNIKQIHANKTWIDVANKNFSKSLDLKSFEFKKGQKQKMKGTFFISELNDRLKFLQYGNNQSKFVSTPFEDKKSFFTIFNSFQCSSRTEKCLNRKLPSIQQYDLKNYKNKSHLPAMIFAFQDSEICDRIYSLILYAIDNSTSNENEKIRSKTFLQLFLVKFLNWNFAKKRMLSTQFGQEKFQLKVTGTMPPEQQKATKINHWIYEQQEIKFLPQSDKQQQAHVDRFNTIIDENSLGYLPAKEKNSKILYASENFYVFLRFLYALYQRIAKLKQIAQNQQKIILFELLYFSCIKTKQTVKFQQTLNNLFGRQAYLFSTIYKLFENLVKSLSLVGSCPLTIEAFKYSGKIQCEEVYLLLINRYLLENGAFNQRIIRINYFPETTVIYLNSLSSYYKTEQGQRDQYKKRSQISRNIQIYTLQHLDIGGGQKRKRKVNQYWQSNGLQYFFDSSNYKMTTMGQRDDIILQSGKKLNLSKTLKKQLKRITKLNLKLN